MTPGIIDIKDGWDNEEWGSLEEEPVSPSTTSSHSFPNSNSIDQFPFKNEDIDEDKSNEIPMNSLNLNNVSPTKQSTFNTTINTTNTAATIDALLFSTQQQPTTPATQLQSPTTVTNTNANWGSDAWADGEFEPIDDSSMGINTNKLFENF